jgi:hypothetical protein
MAGSVSAFTAVTDTRIDQLGLHQLTSAGVIDDSVSLTATSQFNEAGYSSKAWASFTDTEGSVDNYTLFFFFEATSVKVDGSTFELLAGATGNCWVDNVIYRMYDVTTPTNFYGIKLTVPERYVLNPPLTDNYSYKIIVRTNDTDVKLEETISIGHDFCSQAAQ